jgi:aspartate/methionine/tyrosine aminotransferase
MKINSTEFTTKLREEKSVFLIAGDCFGKDHYIRIGIGSEKDFLLAGLALIDEVINELS